MAEDDSYSLRFSMLPDDIATSSRPFASRSASFPTPPRFVNAGAASDDTIGGMGSAFGKQTLAVHGVRSPVQIGAAQIDPPRCRILLAQ
jgi:hypothetical protein